VSANHISQNFLSVENFLEWKWAFRKDKEKFRSARKIPPSEETDLKV
jgi:hypothetical protein